MSAPRQPPAGFRDRSLVTIPPWSDEDEEGAVRDGATLLTRGSRASVWIAPAEPGASERSVVKLYVRRGPISWEREKRFQFRVQREYLASSYLEQHDIPCGRPLYWSFGESKRYGRHEILATSYVPGTVPFDQPVRAEADANGSPDIRPVFRLVRRMHAAGFHHGRLDPRNILVSRSEDGTLVPTIIDTPQAITFPFDIAPTRMGRFDLLHLMWYIRRYQGEEACGPALHAYGLDAGDVTRFLADLRRFKSNSSLRSRLRAEFGLRSRWARLAR